MVLSPSKSRLSLPHLYKYKTMSAVTNYFKQHQELLAALYQYCCTQLPFCSEQASDSDRELLAALKQLSETAQYTQDYTFLGQSLLCRIISNYPHLTEHINRDLLWFFGGDCLHYMPDEQIALYQRLDELLHQAQQQGETLDFATAKAQVFQLH